MGSEHRVWAALAAAFGLLGVVAGAFGAHALKERLEPDALAAWETASRYQIYHALALLWAGTAAGGGRAARLACALFAAGILLFSGSLYALAVTGVKALGAVTPFGGLALILGWGALVWEFSWSRRGDITE